MGMTQEQKRKRDQTDRRMMILVLTAFVAMVAVGVFAFLRFYNSYIEGILYRER